MMAWLSACQSLPELNDREPSQYIAVAHSPALENYLQLPPAKPQPEKTSVQAAADEYLTQSIPNPNETHDLPFQTTQTSPTHEPLYPTNLYVLSDAKDAFTARVALIDKAAFGLDVQYYIWRNDVSGNMLLQKLWQAAERGVRVRFLLDDNNTQGLDNILLALDSHPNIQVRLFNPFMHRRWRPIDYLTDFNRLNRRMHNKSLTADNKASIVGGRNVADEYFAIHDNKAFADMDVLVSGAIVSRISTEFDRYWQSDSAYPIDKIVPANDVQAALAQLLAPHSAHNETSQAQWMQSPMSQVLATGQMRYIAAQTQLISDNPDKVLNRKIKIDISAALSQALGQPKHELYLVSPYFVPAKTGVRALAQLVENGVSITVLTNSLRATDVAAVHSGYARYRQPLLKSGIQLYEFKADNHFFTQKDKGLTGSSHSLHAKTFVIDRQRVFIGSFNLDPRSAKLNTEMGLVIHQPELAKQMQHDLQQFTQQTAYQVRLNRNNQLQWRNPDTGKTSQQEPEAGFWKRFISKILSYLPIERLL